MDIKEAYRVMQEASGIEVGDTVRVLRKAKAYEMGWGLSWLIVMDFTVGEEKEVVSIHPTKGVELKRNGRYPFFVLEIVKKAPKPKPRMITINGKKWSEDTISLALRDYVDGDS